VTEDEVGRGNDAEPGRSYGWLLIIGAAVVVAAVSLLGHHHKSTSAPAPRPIPTLSPLPAPTSAATPSPSAAARASFAYVYLDRSLDAPTICPLKTDGRTTLSVSFIVSNPNPEKITLLRLRPLLPMGGLTPTGAFLQDGTCAHPTGSRTAPAGQSITGHGTRLATFTFALPKTCPAPLPVQATARMTGSSGTVSFLLIVLPDLGHGHFAAC
jgi:hypothetical protein